MESLEELESALSTAIESVIRSHGVIPPSHESDDRYVALYGPQTGFMSLLALCSSPGTPGPGRPLITVDMDDVEYLRQLRFSWTKIAALLGISRSTLYRRLDEEGVSRELSYSDLTDTELDLVIGRIKGMHPNDGERMMAGHLVRRGIYVPRVRMRASIHRVDPINTALRRSVTVRRRVYYAEGPNSVWHIDGHHKLIRWRFVTHGGIDGYSRTVVYLQCEDNNRASTVYSSFRAAVHVHGLPEKVRSDLGGENTEVWRFMVDQHASTSCVVTGSSTHNERIERLWRDVFRCVGILFYETFQTLEIDQQLDVLNEVDLFCLHYVFLPRINQALQSFIESWNNHPISSAGNHTPNQLFIQGAIEQNRVPTVPNVPAGGQYPMARNLVHVPRFRFTPCPALVRDMGTINPLRTSLEFGRDIYQQVIGVVGQHLSDGCIHCTD